MAEGTSAVESTPACHPSIMSASALEEEVKSEAHVLDSETKTQRVKVKEASAAYAELESRPLMGEVLGWFFYGFCSYFVHAVLIPVVFPLIISQITAALPMADQRGDAVEMNTRGLVCEHKQLLLYEALTNSSITMNNINFTPLEWTTISWAFGLIIATPLLVIVSTPLDYGQNQPLIAIAATGMGALFCLPAGFFRTTWIFPPYIAIIIAVSTICSATHTRHLGLMVRGFIGLTITKSRFPGRKAVAGWLSLYCTATGCLGAALIGAFTYQMLSHAEKWLSLWIVSIFSGLIWAAGIVHVFLGSRAGRVASDPTPIPPIPKSHVISIFRYPHATGSLVGVFLSSSITMCIFTGLLLYLMGQLCLKPHHILFLWLTYFIFPLLSLPLTQPLQYLIRADAVKMQILGFLISIFTSGIGYNYRHKNWKIGPLLILAALQSTGTGILHAYARVLLLDCSPSGKEGAFAVWFSWIRALGSCVGFFIGSSRSGTLSTPLSVAFCGGVIGVVILIFGNISSFGGAVEAGHVREHNEKRMSVTGEDQRDEPASERFEEGKMEV